MKQLFTLALFLCFSGIAGAQEVSDTTISKKGLCQTFKRQGVEIYLLTEPIREYEVTGQVTDEDVTSWLNALSGEETNRTIIQSIDVLIRNAKRKAKKKKFEYDAIITEDGKTGTCIKWL